MAWTSGKEKTKEEIDSKLKVIGGDMLKIEYLENSLKQALTFDVKKFIHENLSQLYERKLMISEAARNMDVAAEISVTYREKKDAYLREVELWIKAVQYDRADEALGKAVACCTNHSEKDMLRSNIKEIYLRKAKELEGMGRNNNAIKVYEKLLSFSFVSEDEKKQLTPKLAKLYSRVGKIQEAMRLEGR